MTCPSTAQVAILEGHDDLDRCVRNSSLLHRAACRKSRQRESSHRTAFLIPVMLARCLTGGSHTPGREHDSCPRDAPLLSTPRLIASRPRHSCLLAYHAVGFLLIAGTDAVTTPHAAQLLSLMRLLRVGRVLKIAKTSPGVLLMCDTRALVASPSLLCRRPGIIVPRTDTRLIRFVAGQVADHHGVRSGARDLDFHRPHLLHPLCSLHEGAVAPHTPEVAPARDSVSHNAHSLAQHQY